MQKQLLQEYSPEERLRIMRDNYESKHETYYMPLDHEEIAAREQELSKNSIAIYKHTEELKKEKARFKSLIDPLSERNHDLMKEIDTGQAEANGELFFVPDFDEKVMITYDAKGEFISSRRLNPDEKVQQRVSFLQAIKPASNDQ
jgi:hypothetical protein